MPILLTNNKQQQRKKFLGLRRHLAADLRGKYSRQISELIMADEDYLGSEVIMLFAAMADEVQTEDLIKDALQRGKVVCLPYVMDVETSSMVATRITDFADLVEGAYGILTVDSTKIQRVEPQSIDLVLVPGVAYDYAGHRLGMGAGYYDRFLGGIPRVKTIAPIYSCQLTEDLVYEEHDISVDKICTERGVIKCDRNHC